MIQKKPIPLVDVAWQHQQIRANIDQAIDQLLNERTCDGTEFVKALEAEVVNLLGGNIHAIAVQSGTAAEFLILKGLDIGPGDEVITVPNSDIATTAAISHTGARFVLVDVESTSHNLNPDRLEAAITPRTRAIVPVHMYGLPARMDAIAEIANAHNIQIVEDATHALGGQYEGKAVGTIGRAGFFSFAPRKIIGGTGNGGVIVTKDKDLAWRLRLLRGYGHDPARGEAPIAERHAYADTGYIAEGYNLRLDAIHAVIVREKLSRLIEWTKLRESIANGYTTVLDNINGVETPHVPLGSRHAWRNYVITITKRDFVRSHLQKLGITSSVLYIPPVHLTPVYADLNLKEGSYPVAELLAKKLLCLPMYPGMSKTQVTAVVQGIREALSKTKNTD